MKPNNLRSLVKTIKNHNLVWRYGYNLTPTLDYTAGRAGGLSAAERRVVETLDRDGIVVTSAAEVLGENSLFGEMSAAVEGLLDARRDEIAALKTRAGDEDSIGAKTFNLEMLGSELDFDGTDVFARFALSEPFLNIANAYFRMYAKLRYYNVWKTFASESKARESQLWHFDREDKYILKLFLYLDDIDEGAGPFTYAPRTHQKGAMKRVEPEFFVEGGVRRTTDEQMNAAYPQEKWVRGTGPRGTLIFADTRGFHKGGEARTKDRLMFTCMFTSPASESRRLIRWPEPAALDHLSEKQRKALFF